MKYQAKKNFLLKNIAGESVLVARGTAAIDFGAMLVFNESGAFMWQMLEQGSTAAELAGKLAGKYGISQEQAKTDAELFLKKCLDEELLDISEE